MKHLGDITKINGAEAPLVDCIIGGSPCQDLSVAGKRAGLAGERSGLYMDQIRIIKEMRNESRRNGKRGISIQPRYMVWENVPGAFSSNGGEDFRAVLEEAAKVADEKITTIPRPTDGKWRNAGAIVGRGWSIAWRVLDAQFWGVPQRRKRIALVCDFGGASAPEILFERKGLSGDIDESAETREETPTSIRRCADEKGSVLCFEGGAASRLGGYCWEDLAPTLRTEVGDNRPSVAYGIITKGNGDAFLSKERHTSLAVGGGQAGQGYPCVLQNNTKEPILLESNQNHATIQTDGISTTLPASMGMGGGYVPMITETTGFVRQLGGVEAHEELSPTLMAAAGTSGNNKPSVCYVVDQQGGKGCANYTEDVAPTILSDSHGTPHAVCYSVDQGGGKSSCNVTEDVAPTITTTHDGAPAVAYNIGDRFDIPKEHIDVSPTLTARCGTGGNNTPAVCIQGGGKTSKASENYKEEIAYTLNTVDVHGVCYSKSRNAMDSEDYETWEQSDTAHTINTFNASVSRSADVVIQPESATYDARGNGDGKVACTIAGDHQNRITDYTAIAVQPATNNIVRRLTPLECERLQGYPDNWTDIGEWVDSKGKKHQTADSARYKAMGNSIALPQWRWVLKRISAQYERDATMASLFDGVGGFPLCWERINGKGSCLWASEIEEFPIAVTKKRFN